MFQRQESLPAFRKQVAAFFSLIAGLVTVIGLLWDTYDLVDFFIGEDESDHRLERLQTLASQNLQHAQTLQANPDARATLEADLNQGWLTRTPPTSSVGFTYACQAHLISGVLESAIYNCDSALLFDPLNYEAYFYRGVAYLRLENTEQARHDLEQALTLSPSVISQYWTPDLGITQANLESLLR